jgi:hypothetical protein
VGVDKVRFAWSPPSGATTGYWVSRSLNGAAFQTYAYSTTPTIEIPVTVGDELMIAVAAVATNSSGALIVGPQSPISDRIYIEAAPRYPSATGAWLLRCATCPGSCAARSATPRPSRARSRVRPPRGVRSAAAS